MNNEIINNIFTWLGYLLSIYSILQIVYSLIKVKEYSFPLNEHSLKRAKLLAENYKIKGELKKSAAIYENIYKNYPDNIDNFINYVETTTQGYKKNFLTKYNEIDFRLLDDQFETEDSKKFIDYIKVKFYLKNKYDNLIKKILKYIIPYTIIIIIYLLFILSAFLDKNFINLPLYIKIISISPLIVCCVKILLEYLSKSKILNIFNTIIFGIYNLFLILYLIPILFQIEYKPYYQLIKLNSYSFFLINILMFIIPIFFCMNISYNFRKKVQKDLYNTISNKIILDTVLPIILFYISFFIFHNLENVVLISAYISLLTTFIVLFIFSILFDVLNFIKINYDDKDNIFNEIKYSTLSTKYASYISIIDDEEIDENIFNSYDTIKELLLVNSNNSGSMLGFHYKDLIINKLYISGSNSLESTKKIITNNLMILKNCYSFKNFFIEANEISIHPKNSTFVIKNNTLYCNENIIGNKKNNKWIINTQEDNN